MLLTRQLGPSNKQSDVNVSVCVRERELEKWRGKNNFCHLSSIAVSTGINSVLQVLNSVGPGQKVLRRGSEFRFDIWCSQFICYCIVSIVTRVQISFLPIEFKMQDGQEEEEEEQEKMEKDEDEDVLQVKVVISQLTESGPNVTKNHRAAQVALDSRLNATKFQDSIQESIDEARTVRRGRQQMKQYIVCVVQQG